MTKRKPSGRDRAANTKRTGQVRLLVRCPQCQQQYDATGRRIGSRFRCHCGRPVEIVQPQGHEASVVRCSSCGAPREKAASRCDFCSADFTIHEQDLNTVCGACSARISDKANYCHHCGTVVTGELLAGSASALRCPTCAGGVSLVSRPVTTDGVVALECPHCVGLWLGLRTLHALLVGEPRPGTKGSPNHVPHQEQRSAGYRKCVECDALMTRRNFGAPSGIIVDVCGRHGVWFDADELTQLLAWIRSGGLEAVRNDLARLDRSPDRVRKRVVESQQSRPRSNLAGVSSPSGSQNSEPTSGGESDDGTMNAFNLADLLLKFALKVLSHW